MSQAEINAAFEGINFVTPAASISSTDRLKVAIVGKPKSGKSWFAVSAPKPLMVYDFDDRAQSIAGKEGVFVKTLIDLDQTRPTAMKEIESDLSTFKYRKTEGKSIPSTFVFDTVTNMIKVMENELFSQESSLYRVIKLSPVKALRLRKNWDGINGVEGYMRYLITEFSNLGNIIFVFHSRPEKDVTESTAEKTVYTDQITVDPQYMAKMLSLFNEVYLIELDSMNKYKVTCKANYTFTASTTLLIDEVEEPDIMKIIEKHHKRLKERMK